MKTSTSALALNGAVSEELLPQVAEFEYLTFTRDEGMKGEREGQGWADWCSDVDAVLREECRSALGQELS